MAIDDLRYDCKLDDEYFILQDGIAESGQQATPYAAKISMGEITHEDLDIWAIWQQNDWTRGFGEERWEDGQKFNQSVHIDSRVRQQFILGPRKHRSNSGTGLLYAPAPSVETPATDDNPRGTYWFRLGEHKLNSSGTYVGKEITKVAQQFKANRDVPGTTGRLSARASATAGTITARRPIFDADVDADQAIRFRSGTTWYAGDINESPTTAQATLNIDGMSPALPADETHINAMQVGTKVTESGSVYTLTDYAARFQDSEIEVGDKVVCTISTDKTWTVASITDQMNLVVEKGTGDSDLVTGTVTAYKFAVYISTFSFQASKFKKPHGSLKVMLYSDNASDAPNALLSGDSSTEMSVTLTNANFDDQLEWVTVDFPDEYAAIYDTLYWIVFEMQSTTVATSTGTTTVDGTTVSTAGTWDLSRAKTWMWVKDDTSAAYGQISSVDVTNKSVTVSSWTGTPASSNNFTVYWKCDNRGYYRIAYNRHLNDSSYSPYGDGKCARSVAHDGTLLSASQKFDIFFRINDGGALKGDVMWIQYFKPDLDDAGRLYCGCYDSSASKSYMYFYETEDDVWVADGAWSGRVQDSETFDTDLWVAQGATYTAKYLTNAYVWTEAPKHDWNSEGGTDTTATRRLASHGGALYCTYQANKVAYTSTPTSATPAWSTQITVGSGNSRVIKMVSWGANGLAVGKSNGLYIIPGNPGQNDEAYLALPLDALWDTTNFQAMCVWNGDLYFNVKQNVYRMSPSGDWVNVGPNLDRGIAQNERGSPRSFVVTPGYLYMAIDAGTARRSTWMAYNGRGWHPMQEAHKDGDRIRELCYDFQADPDRLWWNEGGDMCYALMPEQTDNPYHWTSYEYAPQGHILSSWFDAGKPDIDKEFFAVRVESDNILHDTNALLHAGLATSGTTTTNLEATRDKDEDDASIDFADFVSEDDFAVDEDGAWVALTAVVGADDLTTETSAIASGEYYEIYSGADTAGVSDEAARWVEVEYRVDTLSTDYWTYLGSIDRSPIQELTFDKDVLTTDITLTDMTAYGKQHQPEFVWTLDASQLTKLDWVYVDDDSGTGDYAQISDIKTVTGSDASTTKVTLVKFVSPLDFTPVSGDIIKTGLPWGKRIQLRFNLFTSSNKGLETPKVRAHALKYLNIIKDKDLWNLTINCVEGGLLRNEAKEERTIQMMYDALKQIRLKGRVTLQLRSGSWTVEVADWSYRAVELEKVGESWMSSQTHHLTCVEV